MTKSANWRISECRSRKGYGLLKPLGCLSENNGIALEFFCHLAGKCAREEEVDAAYRDHALCAVRRLKTVFATSSRGTMSMAAPSLIASLGMPNTTQLLSSWARV